MDPTQKLIERMQELYRSAHLAYRVSWQRQCRAALGDAAEALKDAEVRESVRGLRDAGEPVATVVSASDFEGRVKWRRAGHQPNLNTPLYTAPPPSAATDAPAQGVAERWRETGEEDPHEGQQVLAAIHPYGNPQNAWLIVHAIYTDGRWLCPAENTSLHQPGYWMPVPLLPGDAPTKEGAPK